MRDKRPSLATDAREGGPDAVAGVPRRVLRSEARRESILHAAARVFREHGYHQATLDQVAAKLLMTKGSLYYYFESKEEILFALHDRSLELAQRQLDAARASRAPAREQLGRVIESHLAIIFDELQASAIVLDLSALSDEHRAAVVAKRDRFERGVRQVIAEGVRSGDFVPCDPQVAAFAILGAINWVGRWFKPGGRLTPAAVAREFAEYLVRGLVCERRGAFCPLGQEKPGAGCEEQVKRTERSRRRKRL